MDDRVRNRSPLFFDLLGINTKPEEALRMTVPEGVEALNRMGARMSYAEGYGDNIPAEAMPRYSAGYIKRR